MFRDLLGAIWRYLPGVVRRRAVRLGQRRFTVTAGGLIIDDSGRILLLEHVFRPDRGWGLPGGFLGKGEQPEEALRRELREEIALELEDCQSSYLCERCADRDRWKFTFAPNPWARPHRAASKSKAQPGSRLTTCRASFPKTNAG